MMQNTRKLIRITLALIFSAALISPLQATAGNGPGKVTLCHKGNTIEVGLAAAAAHLVHGDSLGACDSGFPPE